VIQCAIVIGSASETEDLTDRRVELLQDIMETMGTTQVIHMQKIPIT